jgi:hypothetical protein
MRKDFKKSKTNDDGAAQTNPPVYRLTAREEEALNRQIRRSEAEPPAPRLRITNSGKPQELLLDHPDVGIGARLLAEAVGSANEGFLKGFPPPISERYVGRR